MWTRRGCSHPMTMTMTTTLVHSKDRHVLTALLQTGLTNINTHKGHWLSRVSPPWGTVGGAADLARAAGGTLGHRGRVRHVVAQVKEGSATHLVVVVEGHVGGENLSVGPQQGSLSTALTLEPATVHVAAQHREEVT